MMGLKILSRVSVFHLLALTVSAASRNVVSACPRLQGSSPR